MTERDLVVDLHIHSRFARATSKDLTLSELYRWGKIKGISVIGTGDFTHPAWFEEMRGQLEPAEGGLFRLKPELAAAVDAELPESVGGGEIRFVPSVEIASIYKRGDKVRKVHQLVMLPSFEAVSELNERLSRIGNLKADGRPILGLDAEELLRIMLEVEPRGLYVPAHIWTPWFAVFGSKSGFNSLEEAYGDLAGEIRAIETGQSSDPSMNWRIKDLDGLAVISNSDAHSTPRLGREATLIQSELNYDDIVGAIKTNDERLVGTIEMFPQEGRYHYDGHRNCEVRWSPAETKAAGGVCSKCGKPVVVGVDYRVDELAANGRPEGYEPPGAKRVDYLIPLGEVLAELRGVKGTASKAVEAEYWRLVRALGPELVIMREASLEAIREVSPGLATAIERMRRRDVYIEPGYDGLYGTIKVFRDASERAEVMDQLSLL